MCMPQVAAALLAYAERGCYNSAMSRIAYFAYGVIGYLLFFAAILYGIGFVGNLYVPKGIDGGEVGPPAAAIAVNIGLLLLFAIQHNVMARPWFKDWWTQYVPRPIERSTFVAASSLILMLLYWQWRPMPIVVWQVENVIGRGVLWALYFAGWAIVFYSSFVIDHFELFGLKQVWMHLRGREPTPVLFSERSLYRWVRHPLMLGFIVAFWSAPTMSQGRLLFAAVTTLWIPIAIRIEERDLMHFLGQPYRRYRERTPMLLPSFRSPKKD
jgi:protein-S-isoprenylcysteine O-methyltransferase Ste14